MRGVSMRARATMLILSAAAVSALTVAGFAAAGTVAEPSPAALRAANAAVDAATRRAAAIDQRADAAADPLARARLLQSAVAARVDAAEAELRASGLRAALIDRLLATQRQKLATEQGPLSRLVGALVGFARRPALLALAQPARLDDLVHAQAVLDSALPAIRERTAALGTEVARTRALRVSAATAASALIGGRSRLIRARAELAVLGDGDQESERAIAIGEQAREIVDQLAAIGGGQAVTGDLMRLAGPPAAMVESGRAGDATMVYRRPVAGQVSTGFGEVSPNGVRARGVTIAAHAGAPVVAPAAGTIRYARLFRSFGRIVIIDHGDGWTTLIAGLDRLDVVEPLHIAAGAPLGVAGAGGITVELRRHGRPVDVAALTG